MSYVNTGWVGYLKRSAAQVLQAALNLLGTKVPEMTDHSPSNPYVRNLEQMADMHEQIGYYVDNAARDTHLVTARLYKSAVQKAREYDYQIIGNNPYTVDVRFSLNIPATSIVNFPAGTIISNEDGSIEYRTVADAMINLSGTTSNIVSAVQSEVVTGVASVTSTGSADLQVVFTDKVVHNSVAARWNGISWINKETLAYSGPTDLHFSQNVNEDGNVVIYFGNETPYGKIPAAGESLELDYELTLGADGYVGAGELTKIVSVIVGIPVGATASVTNIANASGGSNVESLLDLQRHVPLFNRTLKRAVSEQDFRDVVVLAPSILSAGSTYDGKRTIYIYIVPIGGGIASTLLIAQTQTYIDARKVVGTHPLIRSAGVVPLKIVVDVTAKPNYANSAVYAAVMDALTTFGGYTNQKINGKIFLSDIYERIDTTEGVENSNVKQFWLTPYARPLTGPTPPLVWNASTLPGSTTTQRWQILFTNSTTFKLLKGATLIGTFATGATVTTPQVQFTIPAGVYSNGNLYEFYTYPYNPNSITLTEPSIPISSISDIVLTVSGGY